MSIRIWSKKIVAVLHHHQSNPHTTLFGVTGDIDNLGVYVARNGRAKAEVLVDTYNRVIGSVFYQFVGQQPHLFHESHFLPAGEEVFILGTCAAMQAAETLFEHLNGVPVSKLLIEAGFEDEVATTDVSFGCRVLNQSIDDVQIRELLAQIESGNVVGANRIYVTVIQQIRNLLAHELDLRKFGDLTEDKQVAIFLRNLVYAKTLEYKDSTRYLLHKTGRQVADDQAVREKCAAIFGSEYGLGNKDHTRILKEFE